MALLGCSIFYAISNTVVKMMAGIDHPTQMVFSVNFTLVVLSLIPTAYVWVTPAFGIRALDRAVGSYRIRGTHVYHARACSW